MRLSSRIRNKMRNALIATGWISLALTITLSSSWPLLADDSMQPYTAVVLEDNVAVLSGPGEDFYPTERLPKGTKVEVYRTDNDHWLAIRPTAKSFSWVAAEHVELTESGTRARVINVPAKTRVGSQFADIHDVEYISLDQGELLDLVGTKMLQEADGEPAKRWFKIAPPAGEFRWLHARHITRLDPKHDSVSATAEQIKTFDLAKQRLATKSLAKQEPTALQANPVESVTTLPIVQAPVTQAPETQATIKQAPVTKPIVPLIPTKQLVATSKNTSPAASNHVESGFRAVPDISQDVQQASFQQSDVSVEKLSAAKLSAAKLSATAPLASAKSENTGTHVNPVTWEAVAAPTNPNAAPEPRSFVDSYNALNVMLSQTVVGDIDDWKLGRVQRQARLLQATASTPDEVALADALLAKTNEFMQLQRRKQEAASVAEIKLASYEQQALGKTGGRLAEPGRLPSMMAEPPIPTGPEMPKRVAQAKARVSVVKEPQLQPNQSLDNSIFDATGTLIAVHSRRPRMPRYALTDSSGQITRFVSTGDGSSLDHLVNSKVGVLGDIGLLRELNKSHVVALKVVRLKR